MFAVEGWRLMASGRIESVAVSLPVEVAYRGERHRTGIMKRPVVGPVMIRRLNLDGDAQADLRFHGGPHKAVYAYFSGNYPFWEESLGRALPHASFGENLTIAGLDEQSLRIGDRLAVGGALLQVSEPRIPCFKLVMKMEAGADFSERFLHSGRVGTYLRVIEEGPVAAGDSVAVVDSDPASPTLADFLEWTHGKDRRSDRLRTAHAARDLSDEWRLKLRRMLDASLKQERGLAWSGWKSLVVRRKSTEATDIVSLELASDDGAPLPAHLAGQFLTIEVPLAGGTKAVRTYSISDAAGSGTYRITVKREPRGSASAALHNAVEVGSLLPARAPSGAFHIDPDASTPIVLIGAGVGLTPLMSMLETVLQEPQPRQVRILAITRSLDHLPFRARLASLAKSSPTFAFEHITTAGGRPDADSVAARLASRGADIYLCGPAQFMADMGAALERRGHAPWRIRSESFGPASLRRPAPQRPEGESVSVRFERSGLDCRFEAEHGTLLELAEAASLSPSFGCRAGSCGLCATQLLSGEVELVEPVEQPDDGRVLICVTRPGKGCVLDL